MEFKRTREGEVMALARLMNITEREILSVAENAQPSIYDLFEMTYDTYVFLLKYLEYKMLDREWIEEDLIREALTDSGAYKQLEDYETESDRRLAELNYAADVKYHEDAERRIVAEFEAEERKGKND